MPVFQDRCVLMERYTVISGFSYVGAVRCMGLCKQLRTEKRGYEMCRLWEKGCGGTDALSVL